MIAAPKTLLVMPTKKSNTEDEGTGPSSETARIASDLMEMLRELVFHSRNPQTGRREKITQLIDSILRPAVVKEHKALRKRLAEESEKPDA